MSINLIIKYNIQLIYILITWVVEMLYFVERVTQSHEFLINIETILQKIFR